MPTQLVGANGIIVDAVKEVVKEIANGTLDVKEKAAKAVARVLQAHPLQRSENAAVIVKAGAIVHCVALLKAGTSGGQMHAAGILACVAEDNATNQAAIVKAGGIPPLVNLLRSGSANAQEMAAGAVASVSEDTSNQKALIKAGAIPPLVGLLRAGSANAQVRASSSSRATGWDAMRAEQAGRSVASAVYARACRRVHRGTR